jgi:cobalamin-dependent methionine synthase I
MLNQTLEVQAQDTDDRGSGRFTIPSPQIFTHIVTLLNRRTGDEKCLTVETLSDRFAEVMREICHLKVMHKLQGYEVFEILDLNNPF